MVIHAANAASTKDSPSSKQGHINTNASIGVKQVISAASDDARTAFHMSTTTDRNTATSVTSSRSRLHDARVRKEVVPAEPDGTEFVSPVSTATTSVTGSRSRLHDAKVRKQAVPGGTELESPVSTATDRTTATSVTSCGFKFLVLFAHCEGKFFEEKICLFNG